MIYIDSVIRLLSEQLWVVLILSLPLVGAASLAGIVVSLIQAIMQVQDQTFPFFAKIIVFAAIVFLFGSWMITTLINYAREVMLQI